MGAGASTPRQPLHKLSADNIRDLVEGVGPSYANLAKDLHENGFDGDYLASASDEEIATLFDDLAVPKLKQRLRRLSRPPKTRPREYALKQRLRPRII